MPIPGYVEPQQGLSPEQLLALLQGGVMPPSGQAPVSQPQQQDLQRYFQQQQYLNSSGMPAPAPAALHSDAYNRANVLREDVYSPDYGLAPEQIQGLLQGVAPKPPPSTEDLQRHFQKQQYLKEPQTRDQTWQRYMQSLQTQADAAPSQEQQYNAIGAGRTDNRNAAGAAHIRDRFLQERRAEQAVQPGDSSPRVKPRGGRRGRQRTPISPLTFEERLSGRAPTPEVPPDLIANPMDKEPGAPAPHQADPVSGARLSEAEKSRIARAHQADPVSGAHISEAEQARIALGDTEKKRDKKREQLLKEIREGLAKQKGDLGVAKMAQLLSRNLGSVGQFGPVSAAGVRTGQEGFGGIQTPELDAEVAQLEGLTDPQNDPDSPQSKIARDFMSEAFGAEMPETATYALIASQHPSLARMMMARDQATGKGQGKGQGRSLPPSAGRAMSDIKHSVNMLDKLVADFNAPGSALPNFVGPMDGRILAAEEWLGVIGPEAKQFRQRLAVTRNNYIRAITGAQMSQAEAVRIMTALPNETLNDAAFLASMTEARDILSEQLATMREGFSGSGYQLPPDAVTITSEFWEDNGAPEWVVQEARAAEAARAKKSDPLLAQDDFEKKLRDQFGADSEIIFEE